MFDYARAGDTVVVTAIDRLGRSVAEVTRTIADLGECRILLRAIREGIDTATPTGRAVAAIMATLAELELDSAASAVPYRENPAVLGVCRPRSRRSSAKTGRNSCAVLLQQVNPLVSSLKVSESDEVTAYRYLSRPTNAVPGPTRKESGCKS